MGNRLSLEAGVCLCMSPGMNFLVEQLDGEPLGNTYFHLDIFQENTRLPFHELPQIPFYSTVRDVDHYDLASRHVLRIFHRNSLPGYEDGGAAVQEMDFLLKSLLIGLVPRPAPVAEADAKVQNSRHHESVLWATLGELYEEPRRFQSVEDLARLSGYSPSYFRALCQRLTGHSPASLLIKARVGHAKNHLTHSDRDMAAIAELAGYTDAAYFSRQFKAATGMAPSEYRRAHRDNVDDRADPRALVDAT